MARSNVRRGLRPDGPPNGVHSARTGRVRPAVLVAVVLVLTACGTGQAGGEGDSLDYAWWGGTDRTARQQSVVDLYLQRNPGVTIRTQTVADTASYWGRLSVQAAGRDAPDVVQMQTTALAEFGDQGVLLPLDQFVEDGTVDVSGIDEEILEMGRFEGELLMIPSSVSYHGLYFDAAAFRAAGVAPPGDDLTWTDWADLLVELGRSTPDGVWPAVSSCSDDSAFYEFISSQGVTPYRDGKVTFTGDDAGRWFRYWLDLQHAGAVPPPQVQQEQHGPTAEDNMFSKRMVLSATPPANQFTTIRSLVPDVDIVSLPDGPAGPGTGLVVSGQAVSANAADPAAAAAFVDFFVNDTEAAKLYQADNGIPAAGPAREAVRDLGPRQFAVFEQITAAGIAPFSLPPGTGGFEDALTRACDTTAFEQATPEQAGAQLVSDITAEVGS